MIFVHKCDRLDSVQSFEIKIDLVDKPEGKEFPAA